MDRTNEIRYSFIVMGVLAFIALASCTPAKNDSKQVSLPAQQQKQVQQNNISKESPSSATTEKAEPAQNNNDQQVMLNPPHGQPGHRCEIPVGSPLNGPAVKTVPKTTATGTTSTAPAIRNNSMAPTIENANRMTPSQPRNTAAPATGPKPANNPPHGQPWHRCDIAVGSPLP